MRMFTELGIINMAACICINSIPVSVLRKMFIPIPKAGLL